MTSKEFKLWLTGKGATFKAGKVSHLKVHLGDKRSVLPMHNGDMRVGTLNAIKRQLGLK